MRLPIGTETVGGSNQRITNLAPGNPGSCSAGILPAHLDSLTNTDGIFFLPRSRCA